MDTNSMLQNRLKKNFKRLKSYLSQNNVEAYRLYERDIPEIPYIIDIYKNQAVIFERGSSEVSEEVRGKNLFAIFSALEDLFEIKKTFLKVRKKQKGQEQYEKEASFSKEVTINEYGVKFICNLSDYLDTGLFLDHRPLRKMIGQESTNKKVLNLFSYTCSISTAAAVNGGQVTSVDLSAKYLDWGKRNFRKNELNPDKYEFIKMDVFKFLSEHQDKYDIIVLDPPTFSNSKSMEGILDIQKDHENLIRKCMNLLNEKGILYFSTNLRKFKLEERVSDYYDVKDITFQSIPPDFQDKKIHQCFEIKRP